MNSRNLLVSAVFAVVSASAWAQLPPYVTVLPGGGLLIGAGAPPQVNLPAGTSFNYIQVTNPGTGVTVGGVTAVAGMAAVAVPISPLDAARGAASNQEEQRGNRGSGGGFGAPPPLSIRIQGDGIALPKGVGDNTKSSQGTDKGASKDKSAEKKQEKAKGEAAGDSKANEVASTSSAGEGKPPAEAKPGLEKAKTGDGAGVRGDGVANVSPPLKKGEDGNRADDKPGQPPQDKPKDREPALLRPVPGAPPAKPVDRRREVAGPQGEKEQDPVARRIDQGLERNPGASAPGEIKVERSGVAVPRCFGESREGENC